ncbi:hypothetical protein [Roseospira navarrensis]|uniref:Uncharacterized protein n=1 Tax=Roseospira navarrensis TaxID=140058 RepID=A0A7X1ZJR7_9PROT|nr:hypothetical protein [Roseospira navarrensis]MQX38535.1 hypothetical protein [Roseospira navarrensis]
MTEVSQNPPTPTHSVVVAVNDLEAATIIRLVRALDCRRGARTLRPRENPLSHGWGGRAVIDQKTLDKLAPTVIMVELPDDAVRERVMEHNHTVVSVDHHIYANAPGEVVDRRSPLSSLEQVRRLLDVDPDTPLPADLDRDIPLVAANDRGFIPELAKVALRQCKTESEARDRVWDIRRRDLTIARLAARDVPPKTDELVRLSEAPHQDDALSDTDARIGKARVALREAFETGRARWLDLDGVPSDADGPRLLLACVPDAFRYEMADAVYWEKAGADGVEALTHSIEMLLVFYDEGSLKRARSGGLPDPVKPKHAAGHLTRIEFSGARDRLDQVAQWFDPAVRKTWPAEIGRLECYAGGGDSAYFGARDALGGQAQALSDLVECLLGDLLTGNRRVAAWRTSFVQALALGDPIPTAATTDADDEGDARIPTVSTLKRRVLDYLSAWHETPRGGGRPEPVAIGDEEWHYFLPHLRDLMAWRPDPASPDFSDARSQPSAAQPPFEQAVKQIEWGRALVSLALPTEDLSFTLYRKAEPKKPKTGYREPVSLDVTGLRLHFFYNDVVMVEWTVGEDPPALKKDEKFQQITWVELLAPKREDVKRPLGQVIEINGKLRFTHSTMCSEGGEQGRPSEITLKRADAEDATLPHGAEISTTPFTGWFPSLLDYALGLKQEDLASDGALPANGDPRVRALFDDRARVIASVVPFGRLPATPRGKDLFDVMLTRLTTVDPYGTGHTCDPDFAVKEYKAGLYERYLCWGTRYMATAHSFVCVVMDGPDGFARGVIHGIHMATMYRRMALVAQAYVAALGTFSLQVTDALRFVTDPSPKAVGTRWTRETRDKTLATLYHALHRRQLEFTNHIWFERMSSQVQGLELFETMSKRTGCTADYQMVRDEIQQMQNFLSAEEDARNNTLIAEEERRERTIAAIALPFAVLFAVLGSQDIASHFFLWPLLERATTALGASAGYTWVLASLFAMAVAGLIALAVSPGLFRAWPWIGRRVETKQGRTTWQKGARRTLAAGAALLFGLGLALQSSGHVSLDAGDRTTTATAAGQLPGD